MKTLLILLLVSFTLPSLAQRLVSPEVHPDHSITFRLKAPKAKKVELQCEGTKKTDMQMGSAGEWSVTTGVMQPDIYSYSFVVDGLPIIDPNNSFIKYNLLNTVSQVHVPGPNTLPWEINDVPHGQVHTTYYKSAAIGDNRHFMVYTPPNYDPLAKQTYPVLYLLHGFSDNDDAWTSVGCANIILDNLIARGQAKPMIVVMPLGYGNWKIITDGWKGIQNSEIALDSYNKFRESLFTEVMPQVEKEFNASHDAKSRAIAGLSMGGAQSLYFGLNAPDKFNWIGAFSSGGISDFDARFPNISESLNAKIKLLWIACGQQDGLLASNQKLVQWLKSKGVHYNWIETPGYHSFMVWRPYLAEFLPLLFQE
jgi:enterochelin esterase family protein